MQALVLLDEMRDVHLCRANVVTVITTVSDCKRANGGTALVLLDEMRGVRLSSAHVPQSALARGPTVQALVLLDEMRDVQLCRAYLSQWTRS